MLMWVATSIMYASTNHYICSSSPMISPVLTYMRWCRRIFSINWSKVASRTISSSGWKSTWLMSMEHRRQVRFSMTLINGTFTNNCHINSSSNHTHYQHCCCCSFLQASPVSSRPQLQTMDRRRFQSSYEGLPTGTQRLCTIRHHPHHHCIYWCLLYCPSQHYWFSVYHTDARCSRSLLQV